MRATLPLSLCVFISERCTFNLYRVDVLHCTLAHGLCCVLSVNSFNDYNVHSNVSKMIAHGEIDCSKCIPFCCLTACVWVCVFLLLHRPHTIMRKCSVDALSIMFISNRIARVNLPSRLVNWNYRPFNKSSEKNCKISYDFINENYAKLLGYDCTVHFCEEWKKKTPSQIT